MKLQWRFGIIAGLFLAIFSLYPQMKMLYLRGAEWNGHYAYNDVDEVAYGSYLKALIDGRPRKNDPYTGRDDSVESPQPESLFSIQFAGPMTVAIPARILGIGAPWAMTISGALAAFLTALAIFWLLGMITGDSIFAMAGSLVVLAGGALWAGEGAIGEILGTSYSYPYFPGFRRYIPAMAFPAFFLLIGLVWKVIDRETPKTEDQKLQPQNQILIALAILAFAYTVFSYFYVWTTAAAWLGCLGLLFVIVRPPGVWDDVKRFAFLGVGCLLALVPYAYLLSKRSHTMDDIQLLVRTRSLDLTRTPELVGFVVLVVLVIGIFLKMFALRDRATLFAISLALTPMIVFNQQLITGQSLQPIHYQVFIGNYVAGLAVVVTFGLIWRTADGRERIGGKLAMAALALIAAGWGFVECHYTVRVLDDVNVMRDEAYPVGKRLTELAANDPNKYKQVVLHLGIAEGDDLPTIAPQSVLWARHQHVFPGLDWQESKERYYQQLLYQGVEERQLSNGMKKGEDFVSMIALFGWGRHTDRLNSEYKPLTFGEIDEEGRKYAEYSRNFNARGQGIPRLDYLVTPIELEQYLDNVDKWYERTDREQFGKYVLYRLALKSEPSVVAGG
ncbi:MAG: hypothetical protein KBF83_10875 [Pyrinomonadaceae bacterium]|nr:hypothetical protein [Pyrinomonadaceae bacterium]